MPEHKPYIRLTNAFSWVAPRFVVRCPCGFVCDRHFKRPPAEKCSDKHESGKEKTHA